MKLNNSDYEFFYRVISALMDANRKEVAENVLDWLKEKVKVKISDGL